MKVELEPMQQPVRKVVGRPPTTQPPTVLTNGPTVKFGMQLNLTLQANFVETSKPTNTIITPTANQKMTNALAVVTGKASDEWQVTGVWFQLNNLPWHLASTTNGWANWSATLPLVAGINTIKAYALDLGGNYSTTNTVSVVSGSTFKLLLASGLGQPPGPNGVTFTLDLSSNLTGHIEYSTDLLNWLTWTNFRATNSAIILHDWTATNFDKRFYRAVIP